MNEKAIAVCKDVLKRLRYLKIEHRGYVEGEKLRIPKGAQDLQEIIPELQKKCHVCLLGACFLSKVRLFDEAPLDLFFISDKDTGGIDQRDVDKQLEQVFDGETLAYMESAFELAPFLRHLGCYGDEHLNGAIVFGAQYSDLRERVRAVMQEVIRQGGMWRPEPATYKEMNTALAKLHRSD